MKWLGWVQIQPDRCPYRKKETQKEAPWTHMHRGKATRGHNEKVTIWMPRRKASEGTKPANILILDLEKYEKINFCSSYPNLVVFCYGIWHCGIYSLLSKYHISDLCSCQLCLKPSLLIQRKNHKWLKWITRIYYKDLPIVPGIHHATQSSPPSHTHNSLILPPNTSCSFHSSDTEWPLITILPTH